MAWNEEIATQIGNLFGYDFGGRATDGRLTAAVQAGDPQKAAEFWKIQMGLANDSMSMNDVLDYFVEQEATKQAENYGNLAKPPYEKFTPYDEPAPEFKPFQLSDYLADPGYQFRLEEGNKAIDRAAAARGNFYSGGALKEAQRFGQDLASQEFNNAYNRYNQDFATASGEHTNAYNRHNQDFGIGYNQAKGDSDTLYNRLAGMTNTGLGATNTAVNANQNNANVAGSIYGNVGNANAANALNKGNIWSNSFSSMLGGGGGGGGGSSYNPVAAAKGLPWSDIRLKENIRLVGEQNGVPVYSFSYRGEPGRYVGVIAQEVAETHPEAVHSHNGLLCVDYDAIGVDYGRVS